MKDTKQTTDLSAQTQHKNCSTLIDNQLYKSFCTSTNELIKHITIGNAMGVCLIAAAAGVALYCNRLS